MNMDLNMDMAWIRNDEVRKRIGYDLLFHGNAFVVEADDGTSQTRIPPWKMIVLREGKHLRKILRQRPKIIGYRVDGPNGGVYKPEHVWHARLEHVSPPKKE